MGGAFDYDGNEDHEKNRVQYDVRGTHDSIPHGGRSKLLGYVAEGYRPENRADRNRADQAVDQQPEALPSASGGMREACDSGDADSVANEPEEVDRSECWHVIDEGPRDAVHDETQRGNE